MTAKPYMGHEVINGVHVWAEWSRDMEGGVRLRVHTDDYEHHLFMFPGVVGRARRTRRRLAGKQARLDRRRAALEAEDSVGEA